MLRFFRAIRKQLMEKNKVRTYILYAVGEIALVMIGILLAIQINTAFENRVNEKTHQRLVAELSSEFQNNLAQLDTVIQYQNLVHESAVNLLDVISKEGQGTTGDEFRKMLFEFGYNWTFDPTNGVLASSISSGDIHLLKNDSLKTLLFSWEGLVVDAREEQVKAITDYERIGKYQESHVMTADILQYNRDQYEVPESFYESDYNALLQDPQYENLIVHRIILTKDILFELVPLRESNLQILKLLLQEEDN